MADSLSGSALVAFEGIDCSGKTTQSLLLRDRLRHSGVAAEHVSLSEQSWFKASLKRFVAGRPEIQFYSHALRRLIDELILPFLRSGNTVIADRYVMSFFAYQSFLGVKASELMALLPPDRPEPTITMVLNIPIPAAKDRCARRTGLDLVPESLSSDERQTHAAEYYAGQAGDRVVHLDALQSRAIVAEQAWQAYEALTGR